MRSVGSVACLAELAEPPSGVCHTKYSRHICDLFRARSRADLVSSSALMYQVPCGEQVSVELDKEQLQRQVVAVANNTGLDVCRLQAEEFPDGSLLTVALKVADARLVSVLVGSSSSRDIASSLGMELLALEVVPLP
jgi:hypothetical protein